MINRGNFSAEKVRKHVLGHSVENWMIYDRGLRGFVLVRHWHASEPGFCVPEIGVQGHIKSTHSKRPSGSSPPTRLVGHSHPGYGGAHCLVLPRLPSRAARLEMTDKMYWAARCKSCSGMVGYRDVRHLSDAQGAKAEENRPAGTITRLCDHCGTVGDFDLRLLRPTPVRSLFPSLP